MKEEWRNIPNYEYDYQISDLGNIKSLKFNRDKLLKPSLNKKGYLQVALSKNGNCKTEMIHKLIAVVFKGHTPNKMVTVVDHINGVKSDNNVNNIQLLTNRENLSKDKKNCTSKYTGVTWHKRDKKWRAAIKIDNRTIHLGYYILEIEASLEYDRALNHYIMYGSLDYYDFKTRRKQIQLNTAVNHE